MLHADSDATTDRMSVETANQAIPLNIEPKMSTAQLKHIEDVANIMKKEPKLKTDIKRTTY